MQFGDQSDRRPRGRDRDEPARVALVGAGVEGDRLPDREDRRQARGRLHARRAAATKSPAARRRRRSSRRIDYVVTKIPRFAFEKFPAADARLTTQMKSVGEVMAIGRTFQESLQKALRGLETGKAGSIRRAGPGRRRRPRPRSTRAARAGPERVFYVADAFRAGMSVEDVHALTVDRSVVPRPDRGARRDRAVRRRQRPRRRSTRSAPARAQAQGLLRRAPRATARHERIGRARSCATRFGVRPGLQARRFVRGRIRDDDRVHVFDLRGRMRGRADRSRDKIMVLGGGPNRIGQGIEFDYCCVHAALALREDGFETIMVNCNPETVSTDYDTSDRLYFEPLTLEDVLEIVASRKAEGVIVQYGGQTPLKLARALEAQRRADHRHLAGFDRPGRRPRALPATGREARPDATARIAPRAIPTKRSRSRARSATRWSCARATCSAAAPWKSCTTTPTCARYIRDAVQACRTIRRCCSTASSTTRSRSTSTSSPTDGNVADRRRHGAHRGSRRAFRRFVVLAAAVLAVAEDPGRPATSRSSPLAKALDVIGLMNTQFAMQADGEGNGQDLPARSESARVAHGAVRVQGDRSPAREDRGALHGRQDAGRAGRDRGNRPRTISR